MCCLLTQVQEGAPIYQAAVITVTVSNEVELGTEVQWLSAFIKGSVPLQSQSVPLQVIRMEGPDVCIGAVAAMAAYPYMLLRAAELRRVSLSSSSNLQNQPDA